MLPTVVAPPEADPDPRAETLRRLRARIPSTELRPTRVIPTPQLLAELLPEGGLRPGAAYSLGSGGALLLSMLATASESGSWCAAVGIPELGTEAAELAGVDLRRLVLVPAPGSRWLGVLAALAEVVPVLAVRPGGRIRETEATRLAARLRDREAVLLALGPWPQSEAVLSLSEAKWSGIDDGHGYLATREARLTVTSRRDPAPRSARLLLPDPAGGIAPALPRRDDTLRAVG